MAKTAAVEIPVTVKLRIEQEIVAKADAELIEGHATCQVLKAVPERRYTLGLAYPAMKADSGVALDGFRDFMRPDAVEHTAWEWMAKSRDVGLVHTDGTGGHGTVVESYIYRGPDWTIEASDGSEQVIKAGDWLVGTVWDEATWPLVKKGLLRGYSPQGRARRRVATPEEVSELRSR